MTTTNFDVIVIGGGAAGLSAAVTLARARRSVVVIDSGTPRNAPSTGVHGFVSRDGIRPAELLRLSRAELDFYGGSFILGEAERAIGKENEFEVELADGTRIGARRLLVTTGLVDELPDIPGLAEHWGRDVHHCPFCHGWELAGHAVGVLGTGPMAVHQALMFRQWAPDLTFFTHTAPDLTDDEREQFAALDIRVVGGLVESVEAADGKLSGVKLTDGPIVPVESLVIRPRFVARSGILSSLGLTATEHPMGVGEFIAADVVGLTAVPGVWVAGNVTDLMATVVSSAAAGNLAAAAVNADLTTEDTRRAVLAYRESRSLAAGVTS